MSSSQTRVPRTRLVIALTALLLIAATAGAQVRDWPTETPPHPLAPRDFRFPPYVIRTLPNGLRVVVVQHHEQPVVSLRLLVRAGSATDPRERKGVASLAASLLDQGTTTRSAQQVADLIDSIGGTLGTGAGTDLSFVNVVVMKDSFTLGLDVLSDVARNPAFAPAEVDRQRRQAISALRVSYEDPDYIASTVFDRLVYGGHPYGLPATGTPDTLAAVTAEDLHAFHDRLFVPNNAILAVVGDVAVEDAFAAVARVFGGWARQDVPPTVTMDPPPSAARVVIIDKPGAVQTEIRVGQLVLPRRHPDYLAMDVAIKILGGEGSNRLHRVLRSERGLTYSAEADLQAFQQAGDFAAETDTRTDTTGEVLRLIVDEISRLQRERVGERELGDAQAYLAGSFPIGLETPDAIAAKVLSALFYELPLADLENYRERVHAITPDDIQRVARKYIRPDSLSIVLVGDAARFKDQLRGLGFDRYDIVALTDLDLTAADLRRPTPSASANSAAMAPRP